MSKKDISETVVIFEDWAEVDGAIWYKWRLENEKEWHWKKTAYKQKPVLYMKVLPREEFDLVYKNREEL